MMIALQINNADAGDWESGFDNVTLYLEGINAVGDILEVIIKPAGNGRFTADFHKYDKGGNQMTSERYVD